MTIVNIERDMIWADASARVAFSAAVALGPSMTVATSGTVGQRTSFVQSEDDVLTSGGNFINVGCLILPPPELETVPYRVIGDVMGPSGNDVVCQYGYNTAGTVSQIRSIGRNEVDALVAIPSLDSADGDFGKPICFFFSVRRDSTDPVIAFLSVQRLISKPPQYASASS